MSARSTRIRRLCDLTDRQEHAARLVMARSDGAVRQAKTTKAESLARTHATLQSAPAKLRSGLFRAAQDTTVRHDAQIEASVAQLKLDKDSWEQTRIRANSMTKLSERIVKRERMAAERAAERELGDVISSRIARKRMNASSTGGSK